MIPLIARCEQTNRVRCLRRSEVMEPLETSNELMEMRRRTTPWGRWLVLALVATTAMVTACQAGSPATAVPEPAAIAVEPVLTTRCFTTGPELALPTEREWIAADVSSEGGDDCLFILQAENLADTTVIAGELYTSSAGRTFDEFVAQVEEGLAVGQEPDILALQLLNTGASGRDLPVLERIEPDGPNRAVILVHESDRRDGFVALSAVIDVPTESVTESTHAIVVWGLLLPPSIGRPDQSPNYQLAIDLINSMEIEPR